MSAPSICVSDSYFITRHDSGYFPALEMHPRFRKPIDVRFPVLARIIRGLKLIFFFSLSAQCIAPLGMESGAIEDSRISASSSFEDSTVGPHNAR